MGETPTQVGIDTATQKYVGNLRLPGPAFAGPDLT